MSSESSEEEEELPQESQPFIPGKTVTVTATHNVRIASNQVEEIDDSRDIEATRDDSGSEKVQRSFDEDSDTEVVSISPPLPLLNI